MGIGMLGSKVACPECEEEFTHSPAIVFKRKFRWTVEGETPSGKFEPLFVKVQARPQMDIEETEINFLSSKTWIPGKQNWERITITTWELDSNSDFWKHVLSCIHDTEGECPPEKHAKFKLCLYDGCGCMIESWDLSEAYISKINFMEVDHSSSEILDVEMDIRYKQVVYTNACQTGERKYLAGHNPYGPRKVMCPHCKHEFEIARDPNIIF